MVEKRKKGKKDKQNDEESKEEEKTANNDLVGEDAIVFDYMYKQNRPYSMLNVFDNLRATIKKPNVQKILDKLTDIGKLQAKEYGKAKIYLLNQNLLPEVNESDLAQIDQDIVEKTEELGKLKEEIKEIQGQIKELDEELSNEELEEQLAVLAVDTEELNKEIEEYKNAGCVTEEENKILQDKMKKIVAEESKRKRIFNNLLRQIGDMLDISLKEIKNRIEFEEP